LSTFWIQYEMTYDSFHRDADRIYLIRTDENHFGTHYHNFVPYALGGYLKNSYSEIEDWCAFEQQSFFTMQKNFAKHIRHTFNLSHDPIVFKYTHELFPISGKQYSRIPSCFFIYLHNGS
jgi:hypothetical protein